MHKAFAKLNLSLNILPKRLKNGLYEVKFINTQIDLADEIEIKKSNKIEIISSNHQLPLNENNLVYQVAQKLNVKPCIKIKKNIPIVGGLGGGSSDAATVINAIIQLYNLKIDSDKKLEIANQIGKDVCYLIYGGLCFVLKDGSVIKPIPDKLPTFHLILIYPKKKKPSTAFMYQNLNNKKIGQNLNHFNQLKKAIKTKNKLEILNNLNNDFENLAEQLCPEITQIKKNLISHQAQQTLLLGSGFGVAGFFIKEEMRNKAFEKLKKQYKIIFKTKTI